MARGEEGTTRWRLLVDTFTPLPRPSIFVNPSIFVLGCSRALSQEPNQDGTLTTLQNPSREHERARWTCQRCSSALGGHGQALFSPGPSALPVSPGLPMHVQRCHRFCFTVPRERSAPILQPSRTETLIKLFENPIKMLYESVCHWQRFREENQATPKAKKQ